MNEMNHEDAGIETIQQAILTAMRGGKVFFTAHHEGGTHIKWLGDRFVFQDYGESTDREEFQADELFLVRLRQFYDWRSRAEWYPRRPPEINVWQFIQGELG